SLRGRMVKRNPSIPVRRGAAPSACCRTKANCSPDRNRLLAGLVPAIQILPRPGCGKKDVGARHTAGHGVSVVIGLLAAEPGRSQNGHRPGARNFSSLKVLLATAAEAERTPC